MRTSIGLNWLRRINRHLPSPTLIITDDTGKGTGGFYVAPYQKDHDHHGVHVPASRNGTIVCMNFSHTYWDHAATIAHEWRHHYQYWRGQKPIISQLKRQDETYEEHIARYFSTSATELDALQFECVVAPEQENLWRRANVDHYIHRRRLIEWNG